MQRIRVLVVDDSLTMRKRLVEAISASPDFEIVGEAEDGRRGVELCARLRPDLVTLDLVMPVMHGLAATEHIMAFFPTPIVIVSAAQNRADMFETLDALAAGAVEVVEKPRAGEDDVAWDRALLETLRIAARIPVITHPRARLPASRRLAPPGPEAPPPRTLQAPPDPALRSLVTQRVVFLGASTGGPAALVHILRGLPADYPLPILLVIHIGQPFGQPFAAWLNERSSIRVRSARDGEPVPLGEPVVLFAPPDQHMIVERGRVRLTGGPERHACRPSVDVLFESAAREIGHRAVGCLLTGMGRDGAAGLLAIHQAGGVTLAQDEATSVVFGMPGEAVRIGAAQRVLPLGDIAPALAALAGPRARGAAAEPARPRARRRSP